MENEKPSTKKIIINYGVLLGIASVTFSLIVYLTGMYKQPHWSVGVIGFAIMIFAITLGIKAFKTKNNGFLILSDALKIGIGIAMIGGIISGIWNVTLTTVIEPEYTAQVMEFQKEKMLRDTPDMTEEQVEQIYAMTDKLQKPPIAFALGLVGSLFFGFIISLITGLILQKKEELY
ncbi:DUF4199 domain-containing protein [Aquimarina pacifica]|uniref:DUF4199 domain-containing protein n=1 Tax=Aquimarina pacifica TaxID=1296415 RepID=UPI000471C3A9|nr:DUF4199 domain-containing protein [Aquimarina pacifica]